MSGVQHIAVKGDEEGMRLDRWFSAHFPAVKHGQLEKMLRKGEIRVSGKRAKSNRRLEHGEEIRVPPISNAAPVRFAPRILDEDRRMMRSLVLYEDDHLIALNKPFGLAVQGGAKTPRHLDGLLAAFGEGERKPKLVHRLDRDTSGVIIVAKSRKAAQKLAEAFKGRDIEKTYWALVAGAPRPKEGVISLPIAQRMVAVKGGESERVVPAEGEKGKFAETEYQTVEAAGRVAFVALKPVTGRKHQLRVHMAAIDSPIVGDGKYGGAAAQIEGVAPKLHLFCRTMSFAHPITGKRLTVTAPLEGHMKDTWRFFGFDASAAVDWSA